MALCWAGFVLVFFSFSTTQEYYSMPCYPALAILLGAAIAAGGKFVRAGTRVAAVTASAAFGVIVFLLLRVRGLPTPGDIAVALTNNPDVYTLSLGHMADLTFQAFAYLRMPLVLAGIAALLGGLGAFAFRGKKVFYSLALMMVLFVQAARSALVAFDPYLGSRPLAEALRKAPPGQLIVGDQYYSFSSIFFYADRSALLLNGRVNNLEYGSYAPGAPQVFIDDAEFKRRWTGPERYYLVADGSARGRLEKLVGKAALHETASAGGKFLFNN